MAAEAAFKDLPEIFEVNIPSKAHALTPTSA